MHHQKKSHFNQIANNNIKNYQKALKNPKISTVNLKEKVFEWIFDNREVFDIQKILTIDNFLSVNIIYSMYVELYMDKRMIFSFKKQGLCPNGYFIFPTNTSSDKTIDNSLSSYIDYSSKNQNEQKKIEALIIKQLLFFSTSNKSYYDNITFSSNILRNKEDFCKIFTDVLPNCFTQLPQLEQDETTKSTYISMSSLNSHLSFTYTELVMAFFEQIILVRYIISIDQNTKDLIPSFRLCNREFNLIFDELKILNSFLTERVYKQGEKTIEVIDYKTILDSVLKNNEIHELLKKKSKKDFGVFKSFYANSKIYLRKNPIFDCGDHLKLKKSVVDRLRFGVSSFIESIFFISFKRIWTYDSFISGKIYEEVNRLYKEKLIEDLLIDENESKDKSGGSCVKGKKKKKKEKKKEQVEDESQKEVLKKGEDILKIKENLNVVNEVEVNEKDKLNSIVSPNSFSYEMISQSSISNTLNLVTILDLQIQKENEDETQIDDQIKKDVSINVNVDKINSNIIILGSDEMMLERENLIYKTNQSAFNKLNHIEDNNEGSYFEEDSNINQKGFKKKECKKPKSFFLYDTSQSQKKKFKNIVKPLLIPNHSKSLIKSFTKFNEKEYPFLFWQRLHNDILDFTLNVNENLSLVKPLKMEVINDLRSSILKAFESVVSVIIYGSFATDLSIETSDIDMRVVLREDINITKEIPTFINFLNAMNIFLSIKPIISASVPVLKLIVDLKSLKGKGGVIDEKLERLEEISHLFIEDIFQMKVDITFSTENGADTKEVSDSVAYIIKYSNKFPEIIPMIYILKHLLQKNNMNSVFHGGIPSFSLFLIVLAFTLFQRNIVKRSVLNNLGTFLYEMLDFYGNSLSFFKYNIEINLNGK